MGNILAAIDFSDCSINALEHAVSIASHGELDVHMVWVNNPRQTKVTIYSESSGELVDSVEKRFKKLIEQYKGHLPNNKIDFVIREGKIYREINDEAAEAGSECIVIGTHGISGFEQFWIGSNASKVISVAECPVITLRAGIDSRFNLDRIIMPIDSTIDTRQKVPFTTYIARIFNAEIHVLSIYTANIKSIRNRVDQYATQVCEYLEEEGIKFVQKAIVVDNVTTATIEYAQSVNANLISIMTEQETKAYNLLVGPYATQMVNNSPFPVLSINPFETMQMDSR